MPIGPPPCLTGRGRASPCRRFCRAGPVLVPWALIAAQARPGAWHGPGTSPPAPGPDRDSAVLSWAVPVPAQRARPSWPAIQWPPSCPPANMYFWSPPSQATRCASYSSDGTTLLRLQTCIGECRHTAQIIILRGDDHGHSQAVFG